VIEIQVPEVAPSLNHLIRLHWAARRRLLKKWEWIVFAEVYRIGGPAAISFQGKLRVRIVRRAHRQLDYDNLVGSCKIVLDALKAAKVIPDDSPDHIQLTCEQEAGRAQTTIQVTPINKLPPLTGSPDEPPREPVSC
jgi:hypothetical protein